MSDRRFYFGVLALQVANLLFAIWAHQVVGFCPLVGWIMAAYMWHRKAREADRLKEEKHQLWLGQQRLYESFKAYRTTPTPGA